MRIDSIQPFPLAMSLGAIQNDSLIYEMGRQIADELKNMRKPKKPVNPDQTELPL